MNWLLHRASSLHPSKIRSKQKSAYCRKCSSNTMFICRLSAAASRLISFIMALLTVSLRLYAQAMTCLECRESRVYFILCRNRTIVSAFKAVQVSGAICTSILNSGGLESYNMEISIVPAITVALAFAWLASPR